MTAQSPRKKQPKKITKDYLHNAGLFYLKRFAASSAHFRKVMMRKINRSCKGHPEQNRDDCAAMLDDLVTRFQESGLLNDHVYAESLYRSLRRKGCGTSLVRKKMREKGVGAQDINHILDQESSENGDQDEIELRAALRYLFRKKDGPFAALSHRTTNRDDLTSEEKYALHQKALARLGRQGFPYDIASQALSLTLDKANEILSNTRP